MDIIYIPDKILDVWKRFVANGGIPVAVVVTDHIWYRILNTPGNDHGVLTPFSINTPDMRRLPIYVSSNIKDDIIILGDTPSDQG